MGQTNEVQSVQFSPSINYSPDVRLIEFTIELPQSFPSSYQKMVEEVQAEYRKVPQHQYYHYVSNYIDARFSKYCIIDEQAFHSEKSIYQYLKTDEKQLEGMLWSELTSKQSFRKLIHKIIHQYHMEKKFANLFEIEQTLNQSSRIIQEGHSLRKPFEIKIRIQFQDNFLKKLFYKYYQNVLRSYGNTKNKEAAVRFHQEIGKLLCVLVGRDYFDTEQLLEMVYCMVYLEKVGLYPQNHFDFLRQKHYCYCLQNKLTIGAKQQEISRAIRATRLYLDELYYTSIRQAEDPEIREQGESLTVARMFPVQRVKQRVMR